MPTSSYSNPSQFARVATEAWLANTVRCPACGGRLVPTPNNTKARDFLCSACSDAFELKSKKTPFGKTIVNGAYGTLLAAIRANEAPNLFLFHYRLPFSPVSLAVLPKRFLVEPMIVKRKPLSPSARRAGWVGCNIDMSLVARSALIPCVVQGKLLDQTEIQANWKKTSVVDDLAATARGWAAITLACIDRIGRPVFTIADVYGQECFAERAYPGNRHVRAKLRQQLQVLRDLGALAFEERGHYRLLWTN